MLWKFRKAPRVAMLLVCLWGEVTTGIGPAWSQDQPAPVTSSVETAPAIALPAVKDKMIYLFTRRAGMVREEYQRAYRELHSPLGMQYFRNVIGYTVNFVNSEGGPDAVTELWVPSAAEQMNPSNSLTPYQPEDMARVEADRRARAGNAMVGFIVDEQVIRGERIASDPGRTPGVKIIWLYHRGDAVPPPPQGGWRVVDNRVRSNPDGPAINGVWKEGTSDIVLIRMVWAAKLSDLGRLAPGAMITTEWRFRPSPWK